MNSATKAWGSQGASGFGVQGLGRLRAFKMSTVTLTEKSPEHALNGKQKLNRTNPDSGVRVLSRMLVLVVE